MKTNDCILKRDCEATMIPSGDKSTLPIGTKITITHRLGGNFTVVSDWGMFRISGKEADALGEEIPPELTSSEEKQTDNNIPSGPPSQEKLWEQLKLVFDPEIPVNIVDLGLVYSLEVKEKSDKNYTVNVAMTLTAPGCGMGPAIASDAKDKLMSVPGVTEAQVELVWDPPWTQEMISEEGKMQLGMI